MLLCLKTLVKAAYSTLGLQTFYTSGPTGECCAAICCATIYYILPTNMSSGMIKHHCVHFARDFPNERNTTVCWHRAVYIN